MKKILVAFSLMSFLLSFAQIKWMSIDQAVAAQKSKPKKILINFFTIWNDSCHQMDTQTFKNPYISKYINENFYPVKFNAEGNDKIVFNGRVFSNPDYNPATKGKNAEHDFARFMSVHSFPTTMFLDDNLMPITSLMGYLSPQELEPYLTLVASNAYKSIKTRQQWESYQSRFKSRIKN